MKWVDVTFENFGAVAPNKAVQDLAMAVCFADPAPGKCATIIWLINTIMLVEHWLSFLYRGRNFSYEMVASARSSVGI